MKLKILGEADCRGLVGMKEAIDIQAEAFSDIIVYKTSGAPIQDIITAQHMQRRAEMEDVGVIVDIGGDHD